MPKSVTPPPASSTARLVAFFTPDPGVPRPIQQAVRLMYAGAAVSTVSLILSIISSFSLKNDLISANAANLADHKVTMSQINSLATAGIVYAIVVGIASIALWIWMAKMNEAGRSWARITASVFCALWAFYSWVNINSLNGSVAITVSLIISLALLLAILVIGVASIYLVWRPVSTAYYKAQQAR
jgi:hypothetical protein